MQTDKKLGSFTINPLQSVEYQTIWKSIINAETVALCGHSFPDGDCLGSCYGLGTALEKLGKTISYFTPTDPTEYYSFITGIEKCNKTVFNPNNFDLIISLDTSNQERSLLDGYEIASLDTPVIVIDHHHDNSFDDCQVIVESGLSSTCEIIYEILKAYSPESIDATTATHLLMGIMTDTGNFMRGCDPVHALQSAAALISLGANKQRLSANLFQSNSLNTIQRYGTVLERIQHNDANTIIWSYYSYTELVQDNIDPEAINGVYSIIQSIKHDGCSILFKIVNNAENPHKNILKCSFRTNSEHIDVSVLAGLFGGGGHKKAAGAALPLESDFKQQIEHIIETINNYITK